MLSTETWSDANANAEAWFDLAATFVVTASGAATQTATGQLMVLA